MVVVDQCYFDDCQSLQSFVLGGREAIRFHCFDWPLTFSENNHVQKGHRNRCYFDDCPILQSFVLIILEAIRIHCFDWPLTFSENNHA